ncbi:MAG: hypothetical protein HC902_03160 [Calothrix sp. SM1_5_4]|nr:hypothetical protein [Calothrix sp. SM1_5_4]
MSQSTLVQAFFSRAPKALKWKTLDIPGFIDGAVETPESWSATATEIAATRYFRRQVETSVRQLIGRVVRAIRMAGEWQGIFFG